MKAQGMCAKALGKMQNEFGYQGDFSEEEEESGYNEFELRIYDPTIARWLGVDPYDEFASPYLAMGNDPVNIVDPDGGSILTPVLIGAGVGFITGGAVALSDGKNPIAGAFKGMAIGAAGGLAVGAIITSGGGVSLAVGQMISTSILNKSTNQGNLTLNDIQNKDVPGLTRLKNLISKSLTDINKELRKSLTSALREAKKSLRVRQRELVRWNTTDKREFRKYFGTDDNDAKNTILERIRNVTRILTEIARDFAAGTYKFGISNDEEYAHVYSGDAKHIIYIAKYFFVAPLTGLDSKAGTLIHETSHFNDAGHTTDRNREGIKVYDPNDVRNLIRTDSRQALRHANTFEYYIQKAL